MYLKGTGLGSLGFKFVGVRTRADGSTSFSTVGCTKANQWSGEETLGKEERPTVRTGKLKVIVL